MGRRVIFLIAVVFGCFLAAGCGDKKAKEAARSGGGEETASEVKAPVWDGEYECKGGDAECRDDKMDTDGFYFGGTVFNTVLGADVTVRAAPSKNGEVAFTAKKDTKVQVLGISKDGWVFASVREVVPKRGWIYGQYVDFKDGVDFRGVKTLEMKITDFKITAKDSSTADLTAVYDVNGVSKNLKFGAFKGKGQSFYAFFCDAYVEGSHYALMPGLYAWDFAKNQLKHVVYLTRGPYAKDDGGVLLWRTVRFTDDKKFFFVGDIAEPGEKKAFRTSDKKELFSWGFAGGCDNALSFGLKNNTVTAACPADADMAKNYAAAEGAEGMDGAISDYAAGYREGNPAPDSANSIEVTCEINLETGERKITGARWLNCEQ